ncbi:MAG: YlqD family protein [Negativicutes bacterium]|nr:YlqD family protein [Negativicutes bacterium]
MKVTVKIPIAVKARVTEDLKQQIAAELQDNIRKIDLELQQIEFQSKRMLAEQARADATGLVALRQQIDAEKQKRLEMRNQLLERIKEAGQLELGGEILQGTLDRVVEVGIGDDIGALTQQYILLENGRIIEIGRQPAS